MDRALLKDTVRQAVLQHAPAAVEVAQDILRHPEPGFREVRTAGVVADWFRSAGLPYRDGLALTGLRADIVGGRPGPTVAIIGELDSLLVHDHPYADPKTGAAHACGHHCQIGTVLAAASALNRPEVKEHLCGRVAVLILPAEEYIEIEHRLELRRQGKIEFLGGKPEFIRLGVFDDVDMAIMTHASSDPEHGHLAAGASLNGTIAKRVQFLGRSAHAGASPHLGINALNAATLALQAIHANRETFRDADSVRVHPIITKGGEAVSAVPADVRLETFVRGRTVEAIQDANRKVDRALRAGAMAVGATVRITTLAGYLPHRDNPALAELYRANARAVVGPEGVGTAGHVPASTDMGDVSHLMPAIQAYAGGATGVFHANDFVIQDYQQAVVNPAVVTALTVVDLLADGAAGAQRVLQGFKAPLTRAGYLELMRGLTREDEFAAE